MFQVQGLSFSYPGSKRLFQSLEMHIAKGELVLLQGANGSGKSTLLRLLLGLLKAEEGTVLLSGKDSSKLTPELYKDIFWLQQSSRENLFGIIPRHDLELWRIADPDKFSAKSLSENVALDIPYTRLSTGQLRSASMYCLPMFMDRFWLLDEPLSGLDTLHTKEFVRLCEAKRETSCGMLLVSHATGLPEKLFDRVLVLSDGMLREIG